MAPNNDKAPVKGSRKASYYVQRLDGPRLRLTGNGYTQEAELEIAKFADMLLQVNQEIVELEEKKELLQHRVEFWEKRALALNRPQKDIKAMTATMIEQCGKEAEEELAKEKAEKEAK
ncbi:hypothetical protein TrVFT333_006067 [Trichoderma virens FT-333]|nr:hypothetical protein TrVFT333_006067 [Trichoderma virens FT-333]